MVVSLPYRRSRTNGVVGSGESGGFLLALLAFGFLVACKEWKGESPFLLFPC